MSLIPTTWNAFTSFPYTPIHPAQMSPHSQSFCSTCIYCLSLFICHLSFPFLFGHLSLLAHNIPSINEWLIYELILILFIYLFFLLLRHAVSPRPGIEPTSQQRPEPLQWQHGILNLLHRRATPWFINLYTYLGVPDLVQWKQIWLVSMRTQVRSLSSLSGLRIWWCH